MTTGLEIWAQVEKTDPSKTKPFQGAGGFKGTATNATYLAKRATELFGPWGIGWGWNVIDEKYVEGGPLTDAARSITHVLRIKLWYVYDGKRGEGEHFGATTFVGKNKNGVFTDEDASKKSLTDAVSKALSLLGFAADIHMGLFDDNKYVNDLKREFVEAERQEAKEAISTAVAYLIQARTEMTCFSTPGELKAWWEGSAVKREKAGVVNGVVEYSELFREFVALGKTLASAASRITSGKVAA